MSQPRIEHRWRWVASGSRAVRRLPPSWVRILILVDTFLCWNPLWAYFFYCRHMERVLAPVEFLGRYLGGARYLWLQARHRGGGARKNVHALRASDPPVRRTAWREVAGHPTPGSCGPCQRCCKTPWLPEAQQAACGFLSPRGCTVYGGVIWDYTTCGRYPTSPGGIDYYGCPRFERGHGPDATAATPSFAPPRRTNTSATSSP